MFVWATAPPLDTDPRFDLQKYMGQWFEIARLPSPFEAGCTNVRANYTLTSEGTVVVENTCIQSGEPRRVTGSARVVGPGKLEVSFLSFMPFWLSHGDYWVLETDHSSVALVGEPTRANLWILSRARTLPPDIYQRLVRRAAVAGFDTSLLIRTEHTAAP